MNIFESIRIALRALRTNKMRTALTMLGIIIGVGAVIAMVAIGQGAAAQIQNQFASMGTNLLTVGRPFGGRAQAGTSAVIRPLTVDDAQTIAKKFPDTVAAVAEVCRGSSQAK